MTPKTDAVLNEPVEHDDITFTHLVDHARDLERALTASEQARKEAEAEALRLRAALVIASDHLDFCGYGDRWERECAREHKVEETIAAALGWKP